LHHGSCLRKQGNYYQIRLDCYSRKDAPFLLLLMRLSTAQQHNHHAPLAGACQQLFCDYLHSCDGAHNLSARCCICCSYIVMRIWGAGMRIALISQLCRHNTRARNRHLSANLRVKSERTIPFSREMCKFAADCVLCVRCALRRRPGPRGGQNPRPVSLISAAIARRDSPQKLNKAIQTLLCNALSISRQAQRTVKQPLTVDIVLDSQRQSKIVQRCQTLSPRQRQRQI
jgi:hypothetical protein